MVCDDMRTALALLLLCCLPAIVAIIPSFGQVANVTQATVGTLVATSTNAPAGGGPDTYYYGTSGSASATLIAYWFSGVTVGDDVTATAGGSLTKIGCKVVETSGVDKSMCISLWKYVGGVWTLHECHDFTLAASWVAGWTNVTLNAPYTVGAGETVRVVYTCSDTGGNVGWYGGAGADSYRDTQTWANRCTEPGWTADEQAGASIYVD